MWVGRGVGLSGGRWGRIRGWAVGRSRGWAGIGCECDVHFLRSIADPRSCPLSVQENKHRLNANMKCSVDGSIARIPYVGTGESEVLPLDQVLLKVKQLVPMMHEKADGGSVCQYQV